ncbi:cytosolic endo-beta-N-acetylglucosaminidase 1 [Corylus avellana]|uniref:cytosolic endo-beta-N-acetylglucosaminidase 1 n=1 Tax=Corylus avellana TaxID=13451 RepID=UPI00286BC574|nr:cytosolic endo-beta-N-acetylglucosaminidase 1 [Corylus avellana]
MSASQRLLPSTEQHCTTSQTKKNTLPHTLLQTLTPPRSFVRRVVPVTRTLINLLREIHRRLQNLFRFLTMSKPTWEPELQSSAPEPPPPFDPTQPSVPISYPIKTLEDLESLSYLKSFHYPFNIASVALQPGSSSSSSLPNRRRLLVCHDMQGGYVDDKWVQGGTNPEAYAIWHWHLIDVFVYFSHSLVTLPPPCWTNTAHRHGVKVLGTFITEWDEGRVISNKLLSTKESARMYAERLRDLAVALGFDGWLINMEVNLDSGQIPNLKEFVNHLNQSMHSSVPGSLVIWYDSVTIHGDLQWQDQLNEMNKPFFDICDGIFVNYTWKGDYPRRSAAVAGDRKFDVYMGIDVFGRNTYGGGQWNTNVALNVLEKDDVSAAIFAPGWVYETNQPPDFQTAQNRWWALVEKSWGILRNYPKVLPFYTNFDQGHGYHFSIDGAEISDDRWYNISCQGFQPLLDFADKPTPDTIQTLVDFKEASYSGGGNITFKGTLEDNAFSTRRLFHGELPLGDLPLHFTYSVKSEGESQLGLSLWFSSPQNQSMSILLTPQEMNQFRSKFGRVITTRRLEKPGTIPGWVIQEARISMNHCTLTEIHAVCYPSQQELSEMRPARRPVEYFAVLGHISIKTSGKNSDFLPSSSWLVEGEFIKWTSSSRVSKSLSVKIVWKLTNGSNTDAFPNYNIYVKKLAKQGVGNQDGKLEVEYLGTAHVEAFYVSDLAVPWGISSLKFIVQVCAADGTFQKLDDSPTFSIDAEGP